MISINYEERRIIFEKQHPKLRLHATAYFWFLSHELKLTFVRHYLLHVFAGFFRFLDKVHTTTEVQEKYMKYDEFVQRKSRMQ